MTNRENAGALLLNVLPASIAAQLKQTEGVIADGFPDVTVLFADIVDFTRRSQRIAPEQVVQALNDLFSSFDRLAQRHGLEKIKTVGDAYMVAGACPTRAPTTPRQWPRWRWQSATRWRATSIRAASHWQFASASTPARWWPG
jgi:class 3 adenylate cyclase